jgi:HlyD family secretion protein
VVPPVRLCKLELQNGNRDSAVAVLYRRGCGVDCMNYLNKKIIFVLSGLILVLGLGGWFYSRAHEGPAFRTARVERGNIESTIAATGNSNAVVTVQVGSQVSGNIKELYANFNTKVKKGQLVAKIDPELFDARVNQARATVDSARAALLNAGAQLQKSTADIASAQANLQAAKENVSKANVAVLDAKAKLARRLDMANQGVISREDRETAQATYDTNVAALQTAEAQVRAAESALQASEAQRDVAKAQQASAAAQVRQAQATLQQAEVDLEHTNIFAPVDGTVVARRMDVGQTVAASFQAPTIFEIAQDLTKMQVDTNVDEADIGRVEVGQQANFTVDAYPNEVFHGQVVEIRRAPINTQNVITYDVVVAVPNPDLKLFPGMTANVKILVAKKDGVLKVPNAALRFRPPDAKPDAKQAPKAGNEWSARQSAGDRSKGGKSRAGAAGSAGTQTVWILGEDKKPHPARVKLGISDGIGSEVVEGQLHEGDEVIVGTVSKDTPAASGQPSFRKGPGF